MYIHVTLDTIISCCSTYMSPYHIDTEIHDTITICSWTTDTLIRYCTGYRYMDTLCTVTLCSYTTVILTHRSTCIDCLCIPVGWIMVYIIATWIFLYSRYTIILRYWYWYSRYWIRKLLICDVWNLTSIVFRFPLSCFLLSTKLMSCYHVTCIMYCTCSWYTV